jgi:hypothetical protein
MGGCWWAVIKQQKAQNYVLSRREKQSVAASKWKWSMECSDTDGVEREASGASFSGTVLF